MGQDELPYSIFHIGDSSSPPPPSRRIVILISNIGGQVGQKASKSGRQVSGGADCGKGKQKIEGNKREKR
jgi:hypothetical protein